MHTNHVPRKNYVYEFDGVKLDFTLRQDIKGEMVAFMEMMARAMKDIERDLESVGPKK